MKKIFLLLFVSTNLYSASWECINRYMMSCNTWRMKVYKGWIVASDNPTGGDHGYAMTFLPDEKHEWRV